MKKISILAILLVIFSMFSVPASALGAPLDEVKKIVSESYMGEFPKNLQKITSIDKIVEQLDPYSTYFTKEEFEAYTSSINNTTTGIGVVIEENEKGILIVNTYEGGNAIKAGIVPGDIILSINSTSAKNMSVQQASSLITGKEGTTVQLEVLKATNQKKVFKITRTKFQVPIVTKELLHGNVGYISLNTFSDDGAILVRQAKTALMRQGATSFILDLTNNGGGYVQAAEELIGLFPNSPYAYKLNLRNEEQLVSSLKSTSLFPKNTKVLVNGYSASASEMTAGALLDQKSATLYGQKTYGKGSMQSFYPLSDGSYLKLTTAHFTGPKGTIINKTGITPQVVTEKGSELAKAHEDTLLATYKTYKKMSALSNVATTKEFTVTFSMPVADKGQSQKLELVKLGGQSVPVTVKQKSETQFVIKPKTPLEKGAAYLLVVHPTFQEKDGEWMKVGAYAEVTVQQ
ncbi:S41 family peptidase [Psychrobacillus sp.]|uniref:S41 family peptidase n=1 Tax=Psychrobacillus sp. TaxID=1871623 RepID=UPI0028BD9DF1|nr:S41 family peptidase [Psychrobacillus sp.]